MVNDHSSFRGTAVPDEKPFSLDEKRVVAPLVAIRLDKTALSVVSLFEADAIDKAYWRTQTPEARMQALELMRQIAYGYDPINGRIERVLEVVQRPPVESPRLNDPPLAPKSSSEPSR
jgi:hypothetical protein